MAQNIKSFISYSHNETDLRRRFEASFKEFSKELDLQVWSDSQINTGRNWYCEIQQNLEASHIIFLLVSPSFAQSLPCIGEAERAMQHAARTGAQVIPIAVNPGFEVGSLPCHSLNFCPLYDGRIRAVTEWTTEMDGFREAFIFFKTPLINLQKDLLKKIGNERYDDVCNDISNNQFVTALGKLMDFIRDFFSSDKALITEAATRRGSYVQIAPLLTQKPELILNYNLEIQNFLGRIWNEFQAKYLN